MNGKTCKLIFGAAVASLALGSVTASAQPAPAAAPISEEYLLLGNATRGGGEPMVAVDPTNPKNIIAVAMGSLHLLPGYQPPVSRDMTAKYHEVANSTYTWLGVTHDGGRTWKVSELPILSGKFARCPDPFANVTKDGTFIAGCEPRETTGEFFGMSAMMISHDKGDTWSKPIPLISSYSTDFGPGVKPRIGGNSPWDRPFIYIDDSTGVIYAMAGGGETALNAQPGKFRWEGFLTASTDGGNHFGTIYSWDSKDYPGTSRGLSMTAGHGTVVVTYIASKVPASEGATCPCAVWGISRDLGKTFDYHVLKNFPVGPAPAGAHFGRRGFRPTGGLTAVSADPTQAGRYALLKYQPGAKPSYSVTVSDDYGKTWSAFVPAGNVAGASYFTKAAFEYSRKGMLALMWRAIYPDGSYDIWSSISRDAGHTFSKPLRVSHARSPGTDYYRNSGNFGDDIQDLSMDDDGIYMVWGDKRAGFQGVWFGHVLFASYKPRGH